MLKIISVISGVLVVLQSRVNGELSIQIDDALYAAYISFTTGLLFVSSVSICKKKVRTGFVDIFKAVRSKQLPIWQLAAGMIGASFVVVQTYVVPIAGVALFTVASLAGQTAISLWVDHVGLAGGIKSVISKQRVIAAIITVGAVVVSAWDRFVMRVLFILPTKIWSFLKYLLNF